MTSPEKHTAHHIQQWVALSRNVDPEILLTNLRQGVVPDANVFNLRSIVRGQLTEQIRGPALDGEEQHADEVQQRQRREDAHIRAGAADILTTEGRIGCDKSRREHRKGFIGVTQVSGQKVREDGARGVDGSRMRVVTGIPFILQLRQGFSRCRCPER